MVQDLVDPDDKAKRCDLLLALAEALLSAGDTERVIANIVQDILSRGYSEVRLRASAGSCSAPESRPRLAARTARDLGVQAVSDDADQRKDLNAARNSSEKRPGSSQAAK
jgi:hypothetical protein